MKNAFTMIELIFVIVILGVLSAVALPKYFGTAKAADATLCQAFVGTLNRTVSHSIWAESILEVPNDFNVTQAKLLANIEEENNCGTLTQYAEATTGTAFVISIGDERYDVAGRSASTQTPAQWSWTKQ